MGAIAEAISDYARPLLESSDGSIESVQRAFTISQLCWNLALLPEEKREDSLSSFQSSLKMTDEVFADFRREIILPMIARHEAMFPLMHQRKATGFPQSSAPPEFSMRPPSSVENPRKVGRNDPCPCKSGLKYKKCCGAS